MGPLERFLDFRRIDSMSGNMADVVQIPIEAFNSLQHNHSIYRFCIYNKARIQQERIDREVVDTPMFDASRPIAINLRTPSGLKTVRVRFPSVDERIGRQRRRKVMVKQLGRGISDALRGSPRGSLTGRSRPTTQDL